MDTDLRCHVAMTANEDSPCEGQESSGIDFDQWMRDELAASLRVASEETYSPVERVASEVRDVRRSVEGITRLLGAARVANRPTDLEALSLRLEGLRQDVHGDVESLARSLLNEETVDTADVEKARESLDALDRALDSVEEVAHRHG